MSTEDRETQMPARKATGRKRGKSTDNQETTNQESTNMAEIEFVDELPSIQRGSRESGVWKERLEPLLNEDARGRWAKVYGPTQNPHAVINNVRNNAAGIDAELFSFAARSNPVEDDEGNPVYLTDKDGNIKTNKKGEQVQKQDGYVFARFDTDEQRAEREAKQAQRKERREATLAAKAS